MPDKQTIEHVSKMFGGLRTEILLLDEEGNSLPAGYKKTIPVFSEQNDVAISNGYTWIKVQSVPVAYVCASGEDEAAGDCAQLAVSLLQSVSMGIPTNNRADVMRAALREELSMPELESFIQEYGIPVEMNRCVLLFHGTTQAMKELILTEEEDIFVEMDRHSMVLVKSMNNIDGYVELKQLAEAMEQTIMSETGESPLISIGEIKSSIMEIGASYRAAWRALEIGRMFHADQTIYAFDKLILERFLSEINRDLGMRYHHMLFNRKTQRLFNEEMLHTIEMFFAKDLNLSDTARKLYIHRNTLVYRLDKIQRQTGLDLRKFEDAITFRMLLLLDKCGGDKPINVR